MSKNSWIQFVQTYARKHKLSYSVCLKVPHIQKVRKLYQIETEKKRKKISGKKLQKKNQWIQHVQRFARDNNITFSQALKHEDVSSSYQTQTAGGRDRYVEINRMQYMVLSVLGDIRLDLLKRRNLKQQKRIQVKTQTVGKAVRFLNNSKKNVKHKNIQKKTLIDWKNQTQKPLLVGSGEQYIQTGGTLNSGVKYFLKECDYWHDFRGDGRSFIKYYPRISPKESLDGFEFIKTKINPHVSFPYSTYLDLCSRSNFETDVFNYLFDQFDYLHGEPTVNGKFRFFCNDGEKLKDVSVFNGGVSPINDDDVKLIFGNLHKFSRDIKVGKRETSIDLSEYGFEQITNITHYWDPASSKVISHGKEYLKSFIDKDAKINVDPLDPRSNIVKYCINNGTENTRNSGNISIDLGCDKNITVIEGQKSHPVNSVKNISVLISLFKQFGGFGFLMDLVKASESTGKSLGESRKITNKEMDYYANEDRRLSWLATIDTLTTAGTPLNKLFFSIKNYVEHKKLNQDQVISLLYELKNSGDWLQVYWCHKYNQQVNDPTEKIIFESGDRLAALFSIASKVPTLFGGVNVGRNTASTFGLYNPNSAISSNLSAVVTYKKLFSRYTKSLNVLRDLINYLEKVKKDKMVLLDELFRNNYINLRNIVRICYGNNETIARQDTELNRAVFSSSGRTFSKNKEIYDICRNWKRTNNNIENLDGISIQQYHLLNFIFVKLTPILKNKKSFITEVTTLLFGESPTEEEKERYIPPLNGFLAAVFPCGMPVNETDQSFYTNELSRIWKNEFELHTPEFTVDENKEISAFIKGKYKTKNKKHIHTKYVKLYNELRKIVNS